MLSRILVLILIHMMLDGLCKFLKLSLIYSQIMLFTTISASKTSFWPMTAVLRSRTLVAHVLMDHDAMRFYRRSAVDLQPLY
jgi:hypothetical protein